MNILSKQLITLTGILTLTTTVAFGQQHSITNTTNETIRIEGRNTQVPQDLYFSELLEPGQTRTYQANAQSRPYFAIDLVAQDGSILKKSGELPAESSLINIKQADDGTHTLEIKSMNLNNG